MRPALLSFGLVFVIAIFFGAGAVACGGVNPIDYPDAGASGDGSDAGRRGHDSGAGEDGGCTGLACQQTACGDGDPATDTTVSGVVYAPNGTTPLYNVIVFVPTQKQEDGSLHAGAVLFGKDGLTPPM